MTVDLKKIQDCQGCGGKNWELMPESIALPELHVTDDGAATMKQTRNDLVKVKCGDCGYLLMFEGHTSDAAAVQAVKAQADLVITRQRAFDKAALKLGEATLVMNREQAKVDARVAELRDAKDGN